MFLSVYIFYKTKPESLPEKVDQERIELSSKRGKTMLSTCLACREFLCLQRAARIHIVANLSCGLEISHELRNTFHAIPDLRAPLFPRASEQRLRSDVSSEKLCFRIKLIYCTSIRQRERNCYFRHLSS